MTVIQVLIALVSDPWFWPVVVGLVGLAVVAIRQYVLNAVDHRFELRLEKHRHDLELVAEIAKYELQRRLTGSGLYMQKQHAAAAEVYAATRIAHGAVSNLFGGRSVPDFTHSNEEDVREFLRQDGVPRGKLDQLISEWLADRYEGSTAVMDYLVALDLPKAEAKQQEARNLMYLNEIYFSDATVDAFDNYVTESSKWIIRRKLPPQPGEKIAFLDRKVLDESLDGVRNAFRAELGNVQDVRTVDPADADPTTNPKGSSTTP